MNMHGLQVKELMKMLGLALALSLAIGAAAVQEPANREGNLQPSAPAPDFNLQRLRSQERVRLSSFKNKKPVALVFGSYT